MAFAALLFSVYGSKRSIAMMMHSCPIDGGSTNLLVQCRPDDSLAMERRMEMAIEDMAHKTLVNMGTIHKKIRPSNSPGNMRNSAIGTPIRFAGTASRESL